MSEPSWQDRPWERESAPGAGSESPPASTSTPKKGLGFVAWSWIVFFCVALGGCAILLTSGDDDTTNPRPDFYGSSDDDDSDKYNQTWPQTYGSTTCAEWSEQMTSAQQWAAAADMLTGARNKGDGGTGLPPDSLVDTFRSGITTACVIDTMTLDDVSAGLYLTERERFRP